MCAVQGSVCVIVQNFVLISQTVAEIRRFLDLKKMTAVRHLGFVMCMFGPPTTSIWWYLKFGWNRCSSFDTTVVDI